MTDDAFRRVEQSYLRLRNELEAGQISPERFERSLWNATIERDGCYWMLGANTGRWYASAGDGWVEREPPDVGAPPGLAAPTAPGSRTAPTATRSTDAASDRSIAGKVLRVLVLGCVVVFAAYCIRTGYQAWMRGDRPGGGIVIGFGVLWLAVLLAEGRRRFRR